MVDSTGGAPAPKKRTLFKRAAWQDAPKAENTDIFSHSNEFDDIVAEQTKRKQEKERQRKAALEREQKHAEQSQEKKKKRRKISNEAEDLVVLDCGESSEPLCRLAESTLTPPSPFSSKTKPNSLPDRYNDLTRPKSSPRKDLGNEPPLVLLDDDEDDEYIPRQTKSRSAISLASHYQSDQAVPIARTQPVVIEDDDELEELDPALAGLAAAARERAAQMAQSSQKGAAPVAELFIDPEIEGTEPLKVKVRIDSTTERARLAWCAKQGYNEDQTKQVFFTWKGNRVYDSTTVQRFGIQVDRQGNVSVEGDANIYDDVNIPKIHFQAFTEDLYQQWKKKEAAAAAAARSQAAIQLPSPSPPREPTPEPAPVAEKIRLILKARGRPDFKLQVNPDTTFAHIASAYKTAQKVPSDQPITLMFDGERLSPLCAISDSDIESSDSIEVHFK